MKMKSERAAQAPGGSSEAHNRQIRHCRALAPDSRVSAPMELVTGPVRGSNIPTDGSQSVPYYTKKERPAQDK